MQPDCTYIHMITMLSCITCRRMPEKHWSWARWCIIRGYSICNRQMGLACQSSGTRRQSRHLVCFQDAWISQFKYPSIYLPLLQLLLCTYRRRTHDWKEGIRNGIGWMDGAILPVEWRCQAAVGRGEDSIEHNGRELVSRRKASLPGGNTRNIPVQWNASQTHLRLTYYFAIRYIRYMYVVAIQFIHSHPPPWNHHHHHQWYRYAQIHLHSLRLHTPHQ